jgi:hypothetical protein
MNNSTRRTLIVCLLTLAGTVGVAPERALAEETIPTTEARPWPGATVTYFVGAGVNRAVVRKAAASWNRQRLSVRLVAVPSLERAQLHVRRLNSCGSGFDRVAGLFDAPGSGERPIIGLCNPQEVRVATHEFGHALGLGHPTARVTRSIMCSGHVIFHTPRGVVFQRCAGKGISAADRAAIRALYRLPFDPTIEPYDLVPPFDGAPDEGPAD